MLAKSNLPGFSNVSVLLYHFVCPAKYRSVVFSKAVDITIKEICLEIEKRYDVHFLEIGTDKITPYCIKVNS